jgi:hypothetical protein
MIGGTAVQTLILAIITIRCDWEKEVSEPVEYFANIYISIGC